MQNQEDRSETRFRDALEELSPAQLVRLSRWADYLALGLPMTGEDLLQTAVTRTLEGSRNFPSEVSVSTYLRNAMKSIASARREHFSRFEPLEGAGDESGHIDRIASRMPSPEEKTMHRIELTRWLARLRSRLAGDKDALKLLDYRLEDWQNAEIMEVESMDQKRFDAARKRLERAVARLRDDRGGA